MNASFHLPASRRSMISLRVAAAAAIVAGLAVIPSAARAFTPPNPTPVCTGTVVSTTSDPYSDDVLLDKLIRGTGPVVFGPFPLAAPIPAGTYDVNAVSADPTHVNSAAYNEQPAEQWYAELLDASNNVVGTTPATPDLDANVLIQGWPNIGTVTVTGTATQWRVRHAQLPSTDLYDSVRPVCFGLTGQSVVTTTTSTPTTSTTTTSTTTTSTTTTVTPTSTTTVPVVSSTTTSTSTPVPGLTTTTTTAPTTTTTTTATTTIAAATTTTIPPPAPAAIILVPPTAPPAPATPAPTAPATTAVAPTTFFATTTTAAPVVTVLGVSITTIRPATAPSVDPTAQVAFTGGRSVTLALVGGILLTIGAVMFALARAAGRRLDA